MSKTIEKEIQFAKEIEANTEANKVINKIK